MNILRTIAAIIVGYVLFAAASMLLVGPVMGAGGPIVGLLALIALALIGVVAGLATTMIAGTLGRLASAVVAGLVAMATLANLLMQLGAEPDWYKIGTLVLTVPAILLVGRQKPRPSQTS